MARLPNTSPDIALRSAQTLFWKHGYNGLSTRKLEDETGLTRFTLQTSYGGKKSLFLQTIDAYLDGLETGFLPDSTTGDLEVLAVWFESRADPVFLPGIGCNGCLMLNSILEFRSEDAEVNQRTERFFSMLRGRFKDLLKTARRKGTLKAKKDINDKVEMLFAFTLSMNVIVRAAGDNAAAKPIASAAAQMIRGWQ